jgi:HPt (histidine-containing phosphotransfer) domain-containing protein
MIDWERIRDLRSEIGAEDFMEVAAMFLDEADEAVARLASPGSAKALEDDLHFLKGAALNLGFSQLSSLCQDGERRAAGGDLSVDVAAVREIYLASKQQFLTEVPAAFAA